MLEFIGLGLKLIVVAFFLSFNILANSKKHIDVYASNSIPPYIYEKDGKIRGVQYEILKSIFSDLGINISFTLAPNKRIESLFETNKDSIVLNLPVNPRQNIEVFYSEPFIHFKNCLIVNKELKDRVTKIDDLRGLSVGGFQAARKYLGEDFLKATGNKSKYQEYSNQRSQVYQLLTNRIQVAAMDYNVFLYYAKSVFPELYFKAAPSCVYEFTKVPRILTFRDKKLRDKFNIKFKEYSKTKDYEKILELYNMKN